MQAAVVVAIIQLLKQAAQVVVEQAQTILHKQMPLLERLIRVAAVAAEQAITEAAYKRQKTKVNLAVLA
jgi:hypothetical protein